MLCISRFSRFHHALIMCRYSFGFNLLAEMSLGPYSENQPGGKKLYACLHLCCITDDMYTLLLGVFHQDTV